MQALGQHMDQESPDELMRRQRHGLVPAGPLDPVVLVLERDAGLVGADQPAVGDRDPVRIAGEIGQHSFRSGERALGVHVPVGLVERLEEGLERGLVGEIRVRAEER